MLRGMKNCCACFQPEMLAGNSSVCYPILKQPALQMEVNGMKKPLVSRKKARMLLALLVFLLQALIIVGVLWWIAKNTVLQPYTDTIQLNWHVDIVGKNTCLYSKDEGTAEGIRYHVFAYEDRMEFEGLDLSESGKGVPMVSVRELLEELEVPQTEQPDFDSITRFAAVYGIEDSRDRLYLLLDENSKTFYVVESFL